MLQQDRLQTETKALTNYSVSLAEFIPETLLQLLGKELPLRESSRCLKSQEVRLFIKMQLASSQDPSKKASRYVLGCLWIVCTDIVLPHVLCAEKENLVGSCFYDFWIF